MFRGHHLVRNNLQVTEIQHGESVDEYVNRKKKRFLLRLYENGESENNIYSKHILIEERLDFEWQNAAEEAPVEKMTNMRQNQWTLSVENKYAPTEAVYIDEYGGKFMQMRNHM